MRTVPGPSDRVLVVGAGLSGLAAAIRLTAAGREVVVVERSGHPGGRAGLTRVGGYQFDSGPTVLTMPDLAGELFAALGERMDDWLRLLRPDPMYRAHFADGSRIDVGVDPAVTEACIETVCGPRDAAAYREFVGWVSELYRLQLPAFIDRNLDSVRQLAVPALARLAALGGFRRLAGTMRRRFRDPRLQRLFSFQSMYVGVSPFTALALYAVVSYMDTVAGVVYPAGGVHELPRALAAVAARHGVRFRYATTVCALETRGGRVRAALTDTGERIPADVVVVTADLPSAAAELLGADRPRGIDRLRLSPSCWLLLAGSHREYEFSAHHNLHFGRLWKESFDDVVAHGRPMRDPSLMVSVPTRTDPRAAPAGRHAYHVLVPVPNQLSGLDWCRLGPAYRSAVLTRLEEVGYQGFADGIEAESVTTPLDWLRQGFAGGTPFGPAHLFRQTGPFRPANLVPGLDNLVLAGCGTQPGVGVPMALLSGGLAARRITGCGR